MTSTLRWFKSSYSNDSGGQCVEIAPSPALTHIRDSKNPGGPTLRVSTESWAAFVQQVRAQYVR
ncbi:DUF397 domain-containing protein [Streptomyces sp. NBC_00582]|uniref:DUF397 domain-containing protein n=1 Tax=Streptomyces sp. NBC_00582 TaxID=2975783 RepID=UPI002E821E4E|nr:DUF397 domain-containing protein [Streptomyces sp. NBC_00582]WUB63016.1 DUF397 domain-containing protein [Streptomyces sp. NBC_00582]